MQHLQGISRHQLLMSSLEDKITVDNPVRFIDAFVNHIDAIKVGFEPNVLKTEGRHSFKTDLIGLEKVNGEHSLIMLVYNIKRSINILGVPDLIAKIQAWNTPYKRKVLFLIKTTYLKLFIAQIVFETNLRNQNLACLKSKLLFCEMRFFGRNEGLFTA